MTTVYIPTRGRAELVKKSLPAWLDAGADPIYVMEAPERQAYRPVLEGQAEILTLPRRNMGMGWIRNYILKEADKWGIDSFIMAVDRVKPLRGNIESLAGVPLEMGVVGCGAAQSYHGLGLGNRLLRSPTRWVFPVAFGGVHDLAAINVELALEIGGFDPKLKYDSEDAELQRESIVAGLPWFYDTGFRYAGTATRGSPGGHRALAPARERALRETHELVHKRWPAYVSDPARSRYRCQWKRMMDDYIPDWREQIPAGVKRLGYNPK